MKIKMNQLLRYRNVWLGTAMAWIMLAHSGFGHPSAVFAYLKLWGYGGVDICLFASGLGCYFSLEKDPDILRFQKRRLRRLAPAYLCFLFPWLLWKLATSDFPARAVVGNLLGIQHLTGMGNSFNWYISALVLFYLAAPYLKAYADRGEGAGWQLRMIGFLLLLSVPFWKNYEYIVVLARLPVFYLGMALGKQCKADRELDGKGISLCLGGMAAGFGLLYLAQQNLEQLLWTHGLYWYPFLLITPGLCLMIHLAATFCEKRKALRWINRGFEIIGKYSFEIYLIHIPLYEELHGLFAQWKLPYDNNLLWLCTLPVVAIGCVALKAAAAAVSGLLDWKMAVS